MEFSIRILVAILLTAFAMHFVTIYMILNHGNILHRHAQRVESLFKKREQRPNTQFHDRGSSVYTTRPVNDMQMHHASDFDDMFGVVTGIEAMESECYSVY